MRPRRRDAMLILTSVSVALLLGEVLLRVLDFSYPRLLGADAHTQSKLRPGVEGWYREEGEAYVRINAQGMRDDRDVPIRKGTEVYRIAVLGDSFAEAAQVDVSRTFWRLLEQNLNTCGFAGGKRVEVLNFGVDGYSTAQELITLRDRVKPFAPDLVMLAFFSGNDVRDNSRELTDPHARPYFDLVDGKLVEDTSFREQWAFRFRSGGGWRLAQRIIDHSRLLQLLNKAVNVALQPRAAARTVAGLPQLGLDDHIYLSSPPRAWERAWQLTEALLAEVKHEAERQGARFLLVTLTNHPQVWPDPAKVSQYAARLGEEDLFYPERRLQAFVRREHIDAIFLGPVFARYAAAHRQYLHGFPNRVVGAGHWNERGHSLAAEMIAERLCGGAPGKDSLQR